MHITAREEQFSCAYLMAVSAKAGCVLGEMRVDDDSIDWVIRHKLNGHKNPRPQIDVQLKCTQNLAMLNGAYKFALSIKNYDDLRISNLSHPRILVVVNIPKEDHLWLSLTRDELILRRCGYWLSIEGRPSVANKTNITLSIPENNVFSPFTLLAMLERVSNGESL